MCIGQSSDAAKSSIPHLTIVNVSIKWWPELPFKAGVPQFYGTLGKTLEINKSFDEKVKKSK
jgi:hypothetical protein